MRVSTLSVLVIVPITLALTGCASSDSGESASAMTSSAPAAQPVSNESAPIQASSALLKVKGMSCPKCANNITLKLKDIQGISDVMINMGIGEVLVSFGEGPHPSRAQLASAIDQAGFTLESITVK
ncbi:MAG: heavy-metal-associated domain-containing protein [Phycisphaerales bacterium JB065]